MRQVYTLMLRVMVDTEAPGSLHGTLQVMPAGEPLAFQNGDGLAEALCELLRRLQGAELRSKKGEKS